MVGFLTGMLDIFFVAYFMGILCKKVNKKKIAAVLAVLVIYILGVLDSVWFINNRLVCQALVLGLFMRGRLIQKFLWCVELQMLIAMLDLLLINIKLLIQNVQQNQIFQGIYLIRELLILGFVLIFWKKRSHIAKIFEKISLVFSVCIIIDIGINNFVLLYIYSFLRGKYVETAIPIFLFGIICSIILQMGLCIRIQMLLYSRNELKVSNEINQEYMILQKEYYNKMSQKNAELRSFQHDFNEYIYTMNDMAAREDMKELKEYLADLSKRKEIIYYFDTGNAVANAVVNRYYEMAEVQGIIFRYIGKWSGKLYGITDVEICCVLSNLLKNAFEAVMRIPEGREKKIIIEMGRDAMHEYIFLENMAVGYEETDGKLVTHKKDKDCHGIGMENVKKIINKCCGRLEWKYEDGVFYTWVYFLIEEMTS